MNSLPALLLKFENMGKSCYGLECRDFDNFVKTTLAGGAGSPGTSVTPDLHSWSLQKVSSAAESMKSPVIISPSGKLGVLALRMAE